MKRFFAPLSFLVSIALITIVFYPNLFGASAQQLSPTIKPNPEHLKRLLETGFCSNCDLRGADLSDEKIFATFRKKSVNPRTNIEYFRGVDLSGSDLSGANLSNIDLSGVKLVSTNLTKANLRNSKLYFVNLLGANVQNTDFTDTDIRYPNLEFTQNVYSAKISAKWLLIWEILNFGSRGRDFRGKDLSYAQFCISDIASSSHDPYTSRRIESFVGAKLQDVNFRNSIFIECNFEGADLQGSDLSGSILGGINFRNANLQKTSFKKAIVAGTNMSNVNLKGANLEGLKTYEEVDLSGANLEDTQCRDGEIVRACTLSDFK